MEDDDGLEWQAEMARRDWDEQERYDDLRAALDSLRAAVTDEGPVPAYHRDIMRRHRREWPSLWHAIDAVLRADRSR